MNYFVSEVQTDEGVQKTAGVKARDDVEAILKKMGMQELQIVTKWQERKEGSIAYRVSVHSKVKKVWEKSLSMLKSGDILIVQFPIIEHSIFLSRVFKKLEKRGVRIVLIIHDLELLRVSLRKDTSLKKRIRLSIEEKDALFSAYRIVAHNKAMCDYLTELGISSEKLVSLQIFDYLIEGFECDRLSQRKNGKQMPVIIAGTLRPHKAQYAYKLPENQSFNLFGVGYEGKEGGNISYRGSFLPDELPYALDGSFGLVWDGEGIETCTGVYGDYLKINNPHKTSLYLAAGIPVIIWNKAALADFITENQCGFVVESLRDIPTIISDMSEEQYLLYKEGAENVGEKMRKGYYMQQAVQNCLK